jgi:replication factor C large subunit
MLYAAAVGRTNLEMQDINSSQKDERSTIFQLITSIFSGRRDDDLIAQSADVGDTPDVVLQWVEGNLPTLGDHRLVDQAYHCLARADEYIGLTYRRQFYTLWRYANAVMLLGVADAAGGRGVHARLGPPPRWKRMGSSRRQKEVRGGLLRKISARLHIPQSTIRESYMTLLAMLAEADPAEIAADLELDIDELSLFLHDRARAMEVIKNLARITEEKDGRRYSIPAEVTPSGPKNQTSLFDGFSRGR